MSQYNEQPIQYASGSTMPQITWALAENGRIIDVARTNTDTVSPFEDAPIFSASMGQANTGRWAVNCTGGHVVPGYLIDAKGNVTPAEGRTGVISGVIPAYQGPVSPVAMSGVAEATEKASPATEEAASEEEKA